MALTDTNMIEVTVFDADGNVVEHSFGEGFASTEEQHSEIILLVEGEMRAIDATRLVLGV